MSNPRPYKAPTQKIHEALSGVHHTHEDPIVDMIGHNVGKLQTAHAFKMAGIVDPPPTPAQRIRNDVLRSYSSSLNSAANGLYWLEGEYKGKAFRREVHKWAKVLYKDGRRKFLAHAGTSYGRAEGRALMDVSEAIIDAFKQL